VAGRELGITARCQAEAGAQGTEPCGKRNRRCCDRPVAALMGAVSSAVALKVRVVLTSPVFDRSCVIVGAGLRASWLWVLQSVLPVLLDAP